MASSISVSFQFTTSATATTSSFATGTSAFDQPFPTSLIAGQRFEVDRVLRDVPFFCVGVMAVAMLIFCAMTRLWSKLMAYIIASALVAFVGSAVDLAVLNTSFTSPNFFVLRVAREMSFAASLGLRFIFFWTYAGRRPEFESITLPLPPTDGSPTPSNRTHSASWTRWGVAGTIVQYTTYLGCFAIMILQMIWRFGALFQLSKFIGEYHADAILELIIGGTLIIKFLLTAYLSSRRPRWSIWRTIGPAIFALWIEKGVAIGNLIVMRFSESSLGRLLQALVIFIMMTSLLVSAFLDRPVRPPANDAIYRPGRSSSFQGLNIRNSFQTFRATLPGMSRAPSDQPALPGSRSASRPSLPRRSTTERFSQWVSSHVPNARVKDDKVRLWNTQPASPDPEKEGGMISSVTDDMYQSPLDVRYAGKPPTLQLPKRFTNSADDTASILAAYTQRGMSSITPSGKIPPSPSKRSSYSVDRYTRYTMGAGDDTLPPPRAAVDRVDSPVYGLDGIVKNLSAREVAVANQSAKVHRKSSYAVIEPASSVASSGEQTLARRQGELEQSVRALQLLSPPMKDSGNKADQTTATRPSAPPSSFLAAQQATNTASSSLNQSTILTGPTSSAASDFSLSNFPSPPAVLKSYLMDNSSIRSTSEGGLEWDESLAFQPTRVAPLQIRQTDSIQVDDVPFTLVPPTMPAVAADRSRQTSFPSTTRGSDYSALFGERSNGGPSNSAFGPNDGKRIDVTSFIGGLSKPDGLPLSAKAAHSRQASDRSGKTAVPTTIAEEGSARGSPIPSTAIPSNVRPSEDPILTSSTARTTTVTVSPNADDAGSIESFSTSIAESPVLPKAVAVRQRMALPYSPRPLVIPGGSRKAAIGSPSSRLQISSPVPTTAEVERAFERPRPPPLIRFEDKKQAVSRK